MHGTLESYDSFPSLFVTPRRVDVWLPPDYDPRAAPGYPVLYMHDGQNLFDWPPEMAESAAATSWGMDIALTRLSTAGIIPPMILVGVWNIPGKRWNDYLPAKPFNHEQGQIALAARPDRLEGPPQSDRYLRFLVDELKPAIDARYATQADRDHTLIMGSSMGGLISLYALCEYPHIFGRAGCVSTHWPAVETVIMDYLERKLPVPGAHKLYFDYGTVDLDAAYEALQQPVDALLNERGYRENIDWMTRRFDGADHSESAWRARVEAPLTFLAGRA